MVLSSPTPYMNDSGAATTGDGVHAAAQLTTSPRATESLADARTHATRLTNLVRRSQKEGEPPVIPAEVRGSLVCIKQRFSAVFP
jgi:hypothetical protein